MLKSIPEQLSIGFTQIELPENYGLEYTENFPRFLGIAATNILQKIPSPSANKSFHTLTLLPERQKFQFSNSDSL